MEKVNVTSVGSSVGIFVTSTALEVAKGEPVGRPVSESNAYK